MHIYSTEYTQSIATPVLECLLAAVPSDINNKVQRFKRWQDAHGCLLGKHLLMVALRERGFPADLRHLQYSNYGRPYLPGGPDFNISHSGQRVVCIIANKGRVGIDLEEIRHLIIDDYKDQFCDDEWKTIMGADEPLKTFYHYWTAKESVLKADGRGINLPLAYLKIKNNTATLMNGQIWNIRSLPFFNNSACHIATEEIVDMPVLRELNAVELACAIL